MTDTRVLLLCCLLSTLMLSGSDGLPPPTMTKSAPLELIILHNNDMHARFEQTGKYSNTCQPEDVTSNKCYGGFARVAFKLKEFREKAANGGTPVLYLNAGDTYTGTPWFTLYKHEIVTEFLNLLKPDAISLGNHEFDRNIEGLVPFLNEAHFPVLIANMDASKEPTLANAKALKKSTTFNVNGINVGVIGYLTPETKNLAPENNVEFSNEINAINKESEILKANGVNIIIALGHSGLETDRLIAKGCKDVDIVIGGHSHTFLFSENPPDAEVAVDTYPVIVKRDDGTNVPVVQAYAYTKYLGYLKLNFDANGKLIKFDGTPILLDSVVPRDNDVLAVLEKYRPGIIAMQTEVVGSTKVFMNGTCRQNECNLGNFVADSMVYDYARKYNGAYWTDSAIALIQGGGVRSSQDIGNITLYDLTTILPFETPLVTIDLTGAEIWQTLEHAVHRYDGTSGWGEFLQMSGMRVSYNISKTVNSRVQWVEVLCTRCEVPQFSPVKLEETYKVIISSFLQEGGDGYEIFRKKTFVALNETEQDTAKYYLNQMQVVYPAVEGRIHITGTSNSNNLHIAIGMIFLSSILSILRYN